MGKQNIVGSIAGSLLGLTVAALAVGYVAGVLSAPDSGKQTRAKLKAYAAKARVEAAKAANDAKAKLD